MSEETTTKLTVEDLLPAMVELASIQHDLMRRLERPRKASHVPIFAHPNILHSGPVRSPDPIPIDVSSLIERSRVLLQWLLLRAGVRPKGDE